VFTPTPKAEGRRGTHRAVTAKPTLVGGRVAAAVVAAGALAATAGATNGFGMASTPVTPLAGTMDLAAAMAANSATAPDGKVQTVHVVDPGFEAAKLVRAEQLHAQQHVEQAIHVAQDGFNARKKAADEQAAQEAAKKAEAAAQAAAARPKAVKPAQGTYTSGFGARWGASHNGVDIANAIGTPILSVEDGVVVEAGPASGFGLWVRVQHTDGTITVYGHVNEILAQKGQQVHAGDQIATMGNRGQSTGPHLHFEVWQNGSQKIDPAPWLAARGIDL
jgi:murein DD-endopeptidase MepM/ murein hydrolase activator NlpD